MKVIVELYRQFAILYLGFTIEGSNYFKEIRNTHCIKKEG